MYSVYYQCNSKNIRLRSCSTQPDISPRRLTRLRTTENLRGYMDFSDFISSGSRSAKRLIDCHFGRWTVMAWRGYGGKGSPRFVVISVAILSMIQLTCQYNDDSRPRSGLSKSLNEVGGSLYEAGKSRSCRAKPFSPLPQLNDCRQPTTCSVNA
jgi:hypothetical protein